MVVAMTAGAYNLTVGTNASGTITFKVSGSEVTTANEGDEVTVVITPNTGFAVKEVTGLWYAAQAKIRRAELLKDFTITPTDGVYKFTMKRANVEISATYTKDLATSTDITMNVADVTYTGEAQTPEVIVKDGGTTLTKDTDFSVAYSNNTSAGTATATVTGMGSYSGTKTAEFTIHKATLTEVLLEKSNFTYNQEEQTATVKHVTAGELTVSADGYDINGNKATDVGNYTMTLTGKGNFNGVITAQYSIVAAGAHLFTLTLDETSVTYDGTEKKPAVTVKDDEETLTLGTDYTLDYDNNINAGTGKVVATGKGNYAGTKTAEFTINKATPQIVTPPTPKTLTYNTEAQLLIKAGVANGGVMKYSLDNSTWSTELPADTDANTYKVYYKVIGDANHNDTEAASVDVTIAKAELTEVALEKATFTYNKAEQTTTIKHVTAGTLAVPAEGYEVSGDKATKVGDYTMTVTGKGNFTGSVYGHYSIVEAGAHLFTLTLDETSVTYDGTEKKPAVTVKDEDHTLVLDTDYTLVYENNVNAGTGKVTATGKGNYAGTKVAEFTINKAASAVATAPTARTLTYNAEAQTLVTRGIAIGGTIKYSLDNSSWQTTISSGTDAKNYKVYYKVVGDDNHYDTEAHCVEVTIEQATLTEVLLRYANLTYNKVEQTAALKHVTAGTLTVPFEEYEVSGDKAKNVGNYTLTVTGKGNFKGQVEGHYSIVAAGAHLFTMTLDQTSFTYDGTEKKPAVTVKDEDHTLVLDTDYTLTYENNVNAGLGKVIAMGKGNYAGTKVAEFTINKADITEFTAPKGKSMFFTGAAEELIEAGTAEGGEMQYSLIKSSGYSTTIPKGIEVGAYKVYYKIQGDANHNDVAIDSVTASINGFPLEIAAGEYATYYFTENVKCITEGAEIYAVTSINDDKAQIEKIEGVVPAEMPVLVKNATEATLTVLLIPTTDEATTTVTSCKEMKGTAKAIDMGASTDEKSYYICNGKEFLRVEESGQLAAFRCWLEIDTTTNAAARRSITIGGETTGVNEALRMQNEGSSWYDLNGRKLSGKPSAKGIYIQNGLKVVIK